METAKSVTAIATITKNAKLTLRHISRA
jgi:hypothetical protein